MHNHWNCSSCVVIYCQQHQSAPAIFRQPQQPSLQAPKFEKDSEPKTTEGLPHNLALNNQRIEDDLDLIITKVVGNFGAEEDDEVEFLCEIDGDSQPEKQARELVTDWDSCEEQQECEQDEYEEREYEEQRTGSCSTSQRFVCSPCGKTFETTRLFKAHARYHESMECHEERCSWRGSMKTFNRHLRNSHKIKTIKGIKLARGRAGLKTQGKSALNF